MTTTKRPPARLLSLQGTSKKTAAHLDFASLAALHYAQAWAINRGDRRAPLSLILRRALVVYVAHLEAITHADETSPPAGKGLLPGYRSRGEGRDLERAGEGRGALCPESGLLTEEEAQASALERLDALPALPAGDPWPTFNAVLYGREVVARGRAEHQALEARVAAHLEAVAKTPKGRATGLHRALTAKSRSSSNNSPT